MYNKTNQKRSRLDTFNTILLLAVNEIKKTHIMYKANMSHQQLEKFLDTLVGKELLMKVNDSYKTSNKGLAFIEEFKKIQVLMGENDLDSRLNMVIAK